MLSGFRNKKPQNRCFSRFSLSISALGCVKSLSFPLFFNDVPNIVTSPINLAALIIIINVIWAGHCNQMPISSFFSYCLMSVQIYGICAPILTPCSCDKSPSLLTEPGATPQSLGSSSGEEKV